MSWQTLQSILQTVNPYLVLAITWFIGQRVVTSWDIRKKRLELDIAAATQFQQLYGEIKEIMRLWRIATKKTDQLISLPTDIRWQLLARATSVEGKFEAIAMKLATERYLTSDQIFNVGLFRQACQEVRDAIQEGRSLPSIRYGGGYTLFNNLATEITSLIGSNRQTKIPNLRSAQKNLDEIASVRSKDLLKKMKEAEEISVSSDKQLQKTNK